MDDEAKELLRRITENTDKIAAAIPKPEGKLMRVLGIVATVAGVAGIIAVADIIIGWFK